MSARVASRTVLRHSRWAIQRRAASTTSETVSSGASKAKDATQDAASKAQAGLSRVTSSAGSYASKAGSTLTSSLSGIGGRTGQLIGFVQSLIPPTLYYARVAGELGKIVAQTRNMSPPPMQTIQSYMTPLTNAVRNPSSLMSSTQQAAQSTASTAANTATSVANNPQSFLARLREMDTNALATVGIVTAEVIGFFTVGEMVGRLKLVGYHGDPHGDH